MAIADAEFDAVVIGAGPGGSAAAIGLAEQGRRVLVIEGKPFPRNKVCGEYLAGDVSPLLQRLGIGPLDDRLGGPAIRRVRLASARGRTATADLPAEPAWGRCLSRARLDAILLERARAAGAEVWQPWWFRGAERNRTGWHLTLRPRGGRSATDQVVRAPLVVRATGYHPARRAPPRRQLFGFKVHLTGVELDPDVLLLLAFDGGYAGLVHLDQEVANLSLILAAPTAIGRGQPLGGLLDWVRRQNRAARRALARAEPVDRWYTMGPFVLQARAVDAHGMLQVGDAAGQIHPIIGEGMHLAIHGGTALARAFDAWQPGQPLDGPTRAYAAQWRRILAPRRRIAAAFAWLSMRPWLSECAVRLLARSPAVFGACIRGSGKGREAPIAHR